MSGQMRLSGAGHTLSSAMPALRGAQKSRMLAVVAALALGAGAALAALNPSVSLAQAMCGNEAIRSEQGSPALALPECRAYELVSEPKGAPTVAESIEEPTAQAAVGGGAVEFHSWYSPPSAASDGHMFKAIRGSNGWRTSSLGPALGPERYGLIEPVNTWASAELTAQVYGINSGGSLPEPPVVAGEPTEGEYMLRGEGDPASYRLMDPLPEGVAGADAIFQGSSQDFSRVFFSEAAALVPGALSKEDLYVWNEGTLRLAAYTPAGTPVEAKMAMGRSSNVGGTGSEVTAAMVARAVSRDGERAMLEFGGALYLREHAGQPQSAVVPASPKVNGEQCEEPVKACTIQIDAVQGGPGPSGGGVFWGASADGSRVFFTDTNELTANAHTTAEQPDLYEYEVESGKLTDLTADAIEPAAVQGIAGISEDGGYVYFVAEGVLTETPNARNARAVKHKRNLYVSHDGTIAFIATLSPADSMSWGGKSEGLVEPKLELRTTEIASSGQFLAFDSILPLTGYNNAPAKVGACAHEGCDEIFLYDAASDGLRCASCGQPGSRPVKDAKLGFSSRIGPRHQLMSDGRVFFSAFSSLLPQDDNETYDVYEWAPVGVAECEESNAGYNASSGGCVRLISTGTSTEPSYFADASEDGGDVFFTTEQALLASDTDNEESLYDARVEGGFAGVGGTLIEPPTCEGREACGSPLGEAPVEVFGASAAFSGPGDLVPGKVAEERPGSGKPKGKGTPKLGRQGKLERALKACAKKPRRKRRVCRRHARQRYGKGKGARR